MSGYTPKPGDRIRLSYEGTATDISINGDWVYIGGDRNPWPLTENGAATRALDAVPVVELVTRPFVVGGRITPEMGEPPVGSVMATGRNAYMHYDHQGWVATNGYNEAFPWASFSRAVELSALILLRLGDGSVTS